MKNLNAQLLHKVTKQLLGGKANVTISSWKESLERHPQHPSMQSMADTLQRWGFDNAALRLVPAQLAELAYPYIAHFRDRGGKFVGVLERKNNELRITDGSQESLTDIVSFEKSWSGVVLLMEKKEKNGDPEYHYHRKLEILHSLRLPVIFGMVAVLLISTLFFSPALDMITLVYGLLSMVGFGLSVSLVSLHLDRRNSFAQNLCKSSGTTNCHSVLDSPAASLFGLFSWAEMGMLYFGFQLISLLVGIISGEIHGIMSLVAKLSLLATLYVPFSLHYQAQIVRQWCLFCLAVQVILTLQIVFIFSYVSESPDTFPTISLLWGLTLPVAIWLIVKPYWAAAIKGKEAQRSLLRFQSNESLFTEMLNRQEPMPPVPNAMPVFRYGNPEATNTITIITNPFCSPCSQMHERIDEVLAVNPFVKVETIVLTSDDPSENRTQMAAHWLALQESGQDIQQVMRDWHQMQDKNFDSYIQSLPSVITRSQTERVMVSLQWANDAKINSTPTVLFNGRPIPEPYHVEDLNYLFLNELTH